MLYSLRLWLLGAPKAGWSGAFCRAEHGVFRGMSGTLGLGSKQARLWLEASSLCCVPPGHPLVFNGQPLLKSLHERNRIFCTFSSLTLGPPPEHILSLREPHRRVLSQENSTIGQTAPAWTDCPACKDCFLGISSSCLIVCTNTEGLLTILVSSRTFIAEIFNRRRRTLLGGSSAPGSPQGSRKSTT